MTTKIPGGKITASFALTLESATALAQGDPVHITGPYECAKADGTKPVVGYVQVANVKRSAGAYPVANTPGDVTVEALGYGVKSFKSAGALAAGIRVGVDGTGKLAAPGAGVANIGVTLTAAAGANSDVDVLLQGV